MKRIPNQQLRLFSEGDADLVLSPYYNAIIGFFFGAWTDWNKLPLKVRAQLTPRARANVIYDFILNRAKVYFNRRGDGNVELIEKNRLFMFGVRGQVLFRFKKLDRSGRAKNIQTDQQVRLSLQQDLPGVPGKCALVVIGYQLNKLETEIKAILVTYSNGVQTAWDYPLSTDDRDEQDTNVVPLPTVGPRKPIVRAKKIKKKDTDEPS
jgi:hypothetical protein